MDSLKQRIERKYQVRQHWSMPWQELEVTLGQMSFLNLRGLNFETLEQTEGFLLQCGFDVQNSDHRRTLQQIYGEAVFFIRHHLFTPEERQSIPLPHPLRELDQVQHLLLFASSQHPRSTGLRNWACAILKVMYTLSNLEHSERLRGLDAARDAIFNPIRSLLRRSSHNPSRFFLTSPVCDVPLHTVDWKEAKTRNSIVMKLLHKPDTMVDDVFDFLGVRFVVERTADVPQLLKILIQNGVIIPHQTIPSRTRNSLLNYRKAKKLLDFLSDLLLSDTIDSDEFFSMCSNIGWAMTLADDPPPKSANAFSSSSYKALQFTVRHLVRSPNPAFYALESFSKELKHYRGEREESSLHALVPAEHARYFPLEIQIMDTESYSQAQYGPASHELYKANQLTAVRDRVLRGIIGYQKETEQK